MNFAYIYPAVWYRTLSTGVSVCSSSPLSINHIALRKFYQLSNAPPKESISSRTSGKIKCGIDSPFRRRGGLPFACVGKALLTRPLPSPAVAAQVCSKRETIRDDRFSNSLQGLKRRRTPRLKSHPCAIIVLHARNMAHVQQHPNETLELLQIILLYLNNFSRYVLHFQVKMWIVPRSYVDRSVLHPTRSLCVRFRKLFGDLCSASCGLISLLPCTFALSQRIKERAPSSLKYRERETKVLIKNRVFVTVIRYEHPKWSE